MGVLCAAGATLAFVVGGHRASAASPCPCSLFGTQTPDLVNLAVSDGRTGTGPFTLELGVRFNATAPAELSAIRFYKDDEETGSHIARLWDSSGNEVAEAPFDSETASGWQTAELATPVELTVGATYTASVNVNNTFVDSHSGLADEIDAGPISSVADGNNGVFSLSAGTVPTSSFSSSNYFVDVVVDDPPASTTTTDTTTTDTTTTDTTTTDTTTTDTTTTTTPADTTTAATTTTTAPATTAATTTAEATTTTAPTTTASTPPVTHNVVTSQAPSARVSDSAGSTASFAAEVGVATTKSNLPKQPAMPKWPLRVWFDLSALSSSTDQPVRLSFAEVRSRPWAWRPYRSTITVRTRRHTMWIRFADASGAVSDWHQISIP